MNGIVKVRNSESKIIAALWYYDLNLFSDFTYYLVDYSKEDQFDQQDRRWVGYIDAHHTAFSTLAGRKMSNTFGVQYRNDWINNGLYRSQNRVRTAKTDYSATWRQFLSFRQQRSSQCRFTANMHLRRSHLDHYSCLLLCPTVLLSRITAAPPRP